MIDHSAPASGSPAPSLPAPSPQRVPGIAAVAERFAEALGWLGGVATVYGPVSLAAAAALWAAVGVVRFTGPRLLGLGGA